MNPILLVLALVVQTPSPFTPNTAIAPRAPTPAHEVHSPNGAGPPTPEARQAVHSMGRCIAQRSPEMAADTLAKDFRTASYRSGMQLLARNNESCFNGGGRMRSSNLLFAAAVAEGLLARDTVPLNVRLARAALRSAPAAYSPSDAMALCVVRSLPDETSRLFATAPGTSDEEHAAGALQPAAERCSQGGTRTIASAAGLRSILATAAFRTVTSSTASN